MMATFRDAWASDDYQTAITAILQSIGAPLTLDNRRILAAMIWCEKGPNNPAWKWNNPLDTTLDGYGGVSVNSAGVRMYPSQEQGVAAIRDTLLHSGGGRWYATLVHALRTSNPREFFAPEGLRELQRWGYTGNLACVVTQFRLLGGDPGITPAQVEQLVRQPQSTQPEPTAAPAPVEAAAGAPSPPPLPMAVSALVGVGVALAVGLVLVLYGMREAEA